MRRPFNLKGRLPPNSPDSTSIASTPENEHLLHAPNAANCRSPSTEELGCYFTVSSIGSSIAEGGEEAEEKQKNRTRHFLRQNMSQDAEDGPEVLFVDQFEKDAHSHLYNAARPPMNQEEFDQRFRYNRPQHKNADGELCRRTRKCVRHCPCLSPYAFFRFILRLIPILEWLPAYEWRQTLLSDVVGGLTVGVMHVPQSIAYALLAGVDPVIGLYTSFFPPLFYMLFGTSRHSSIGSFAVVALMTGMAVDRFSTTAPASVDATESMDPGAEIGFSPVEVSSTLAFTIGLVQIVMGVLHLDTITTYFSDQVVAGFTTGASMHVFVAQLKDMFGLANLPKRHGAGYLLMKLYDTFENIHRSNLFTIGLSFFSIGFLILGKEVLNPHLKRRFRLQIPLPFELFLVILATALGQLFHFRSNFGVKIVSKIPTGLPQPMLPNMSLVPSLLPDALGIAAVVIAVHISLSKMFAKKMAYKVDPGQELFALGFSSSFSAFFPVYPASCSLGRTLVNVEAGTKTQFSTVFSSALLAAIILYLGQWLRTLPMCVLSAIICVALKGMFKKIGDLKVLWPLSKIDFSVWLVSFVATVCWDVTEGLAVSIIYALLTTVFRTQWPRWHFLANLSGTNDFRDAERYQMVCSYPGICIFRFDSPLLFTNVDNFKTTIHKALRRWNRQQHIVSRSAPATLVPMDLLSPEAACKKKAEVKFAAINEQHSETDEESGVKMRPVLAASPPPKIVVEADDVNGTELHDELPPAYTKRAPIFYRHFIIDCSGFTFVDCMGVNALKEIFTEMRSERVLVYFAAAKAPVRDLFEKCGFYQYVQKHNFYPTIRDAVAIARKRRNASTQCLLDEPTERRYDAMETAMETQPMN